MPRRRFPLISLVAVFALAIVALSGVFSLFEGSAFADIVHRKNGGPIEGNVRFDKATKTYHVETPSGVRLQIPADQVSRIEKTKSVGELFRERRRNVDDKDLDGLVKLAIWAREKKYRKGLQDACKDLLRIDPNHEMARRELGWIVFENDWILESDLRKQRKERGLVKFRGEWMKASEKARRERSDEQKRIRDLFASLETKNRFVQEFAVRKLVAYRSEYAKEVFVEFLDDEREIVRVVATSALGNFPAKESDAKAKALTKKLYGRLQNDPGLAESEALYLTLRTFQPYAAFRLALAELVKGPKTETRSKRAEELVFRALKTSWVPELCRAVRKPARQGGGIVVGVQRVLTRALSVNYGDDAEKWLEWWNQNSSRFRDD
ncbi:MAG: hypothetical protein AAF517_20280 [Planctomycetota bacterium]